MIPRIIRYSEAISDFFLKLSLSLTSAYTLWAQLDSAELPDATPVSIVPGDSQTTYGGKMIEVETPSGVQMIPIPTNREYSDEEEELLVDYTLEALLDRDNTPITWALNVARIYRLMRQLPEDTPIYILTIPNVSEPIQEHDDLANLTLEHVHVSVRFTDKQHCTVVATSLEECDTVISLPRYNDNMTFSLHWAGVGRDADVYADPFTNEHGVTPSDD